MNESKRALRIAMRCICAAVLTMFWAAAYATEKRDCTDDEEHAADRQLLAIIEDETRSGKLIESHLPFGIHIGTHASQGGPTNEKLLVQAGYVTLHDGDLRTALWTAHKLTDKDVIAGESADRVECFRQDIRLQEEHAAIKKDYEEPIFDRGHLTPDADLKGDVTEQVNSYVLSNMAPQHRRFNRGIWKELEGLGREWAKTHETVYVTTDRNHHRARANQQRGPLIQTQASSPMVEIIADRSIAKGEQLHPATERQEKHWRTTE